MTFLFFNLLANAAFSLAAGFLVVSLFLWLFRLPAGPWKLFLLSLPFVKLVYDCVRGLPRDSILLHRSVDTFALPPKHHTLQAGLGFSEWGPSFSVQFSVKDVAGHVYTESVGDYLVLWLNKTFGPGIPLAVLCSVLAVSATLLLIRAFGAFRFERERRADRLSATALRKVKLPYRSVDLYRSAGFSGTPFTGGLLRPYICFPDDAFRRLAPEEREAVTAHELAHVRQLDLAVTVAVQLLGDLFWFVPGYRWLSRRIDRMREIVADQWAVRSGIEPALLASALVKLREIPIADRFVLYSAFFREKSLLKDRVRRLLGEERERGPRLGWRFRWVRLLAACWIFTAVMTATFGGNHPTEKIDNPAWVTRLLDRYGLRVE